MNAPFRQTDLSSLISLPIEGMTCASCVGTVERALRAVPGIDTVSVNIATEKANIRTHVPVERAVLLKAVEDAGYSVPDKSVLTELTVEGMTCASCVGNVERALRAVPGVSEAVVNLATERATIKGSADVAALIAAVAGAGYEAKLLAHDRVDEEAARG